MKRFFFALMLVAATANAQVVATSGRNVVVAHDGVIELYDADTHRVWSVEGVAQPSRIVTSDDRVAVIDSFANEVRIIDLATGRSERVATAETPVDAAFAGRDLVILDRDARRVERAGGGSVDVAPDPAFMRFVNGMLYVYSRLDGLMQQIDPVKLQIVRTVTLPPFASDFETDGKSGYVVYPRDAKLRMFTLQTLERAGEIGTGAVPVDIALAGKASAISASRLAVADPASKRVWVVEGSQSIARAFARGFLRGLLGLGVFTPKSSDFPTGVDRVAARGSITVAYDSTSHTLYRVTGRSGSAIAGEVEPSAYAITENGIVLWQNGRLRLIR